MALPTDFLLTTVVCQPDVQLHGVTTRPPGRLLTPSKRWQPAATAMCGRQDTSIPLVVIPSLLPTSTVGQVGRSIRHLHKAAPPPNTCMALRQVPVMPG